MKTIQTTIDELKRKEALAIAANDQHAEAGDEITADHWDGIAVAYSGSISLLEAAANPDIAALIQDITVRGENAETNSQAHTDESSRAHSRGIAVGSQQVVDHLNSVVFA